jgi:hypothetical protein
VNRPDPMAFHEAGHAIVANALGRWVCTTFSSKLAEEFVGADSVGFSVYGLEGLSVEDQICITLAGDLAKHHHGGGSPQYEGASGDVRKICRLLSLAYSRRGEHTVVPPDLFEHPVVLAQTNRAEHILSNNLRALQTTARLLCEHEMVVFENGKPRATTAEETEQFVQHLKGCKPAEGAL